MLRASGLGSFQRPTYRSTMVRSNVLGRTVANWVNVNLMQPLDHYDDKDEDNNGNNNNSED